MTRTIRAWEDPRLQEAGEAAHAAAAAPDSTEPGPLGWLLDDGTEVLCAGGRLLVADGPGRRALELAPIPDVPINTLVAELRSGIRAPTRELPPLPPTDHRRRGACSRAQGST